MNVTRTFDRSEFVPKQDYAAELTKDLLINLMANSSAIKFKLILSGSITEEKIASDKRYSFTSDISTLLCNVQGLLGFELSKFLMVHIGTFPFVNRIINDMKTSQSYSDLLSYSLQIHRVLKPFHQSSYKLITSTEPKSRVLGIVSNQDEVSGFFETIHSELRSKLTSNILSFMDDKSRIISDIEHFISTIESGNKTINSINDLVIPNMGKYTIMYDGSFWKIYEVLYRSIYADNANYNDKDITLITTNNAVERYINSVLSKNTSHDCNYYLDQFKDYYQKIICMTKESLESDPLIAKDIMKMQVYVPQYFTTTLAKITLCVFARMAKLISWKRDVSLFSNNSPNRIQHNNIFEALLCLPSGLDVDYTLLQMHTLFYILTCPKTVKSTKQKTVQRRASRKPKTNSDDEANSTDEVKKEKTTKKVKKTKKSSTAKPVDMEPVETIQASTE